MNNQVNINVCGVQGAPYTYKTVVLKPNVVGDKNILTQLMMGQTNTKYVIKYDYVIDPDVKTGVASVSESNISHCVNPDYAAALAAYNLAHDAWIDADNAYTNNPNDTTLAAKNAAYATYTAAQTTLNNTPQFYYYATNAILVKQGQYISIPKGCVLLNASLSGITDFVVAPADTTVYIGSLTAGEYNYTVQNAIVIPSGCLIEFDGGSISNGVLVGDETILIFDQKEEVILKNVELLGEFEYSAGGSGGGIPDKEYDPEHFSGLGRKTLQLKKDGSNILTQEDFDQEDTVYIISNDFDLDEKTIEVPAGCVLDFEGGSINNGKLIGNNTRLLNYDGKSTALYGLYYSMDGELLNNCYGKRSDFHITECYRFVDDTVNYEGLTEYQNIVRYGDYLFLLGYPWVKAGATDPTHYPLFIRVFTVDKYRFIGTVYTNVQSHANGATIANDTLYVCVSDGHKHDGEYINPDRKCLHTFDCNAIINAAQSASQTPITNGRIDLSNFESNIGQEIVWVEGIDYDKNNEEFAIDFAGIIVVADKDFNYLRKTENYKTVALTKYNYQIGDQDISYKNGIVYGLFCRYDNGESSQHNAAHTTVITIDTISGNVIDVKDMLNDHSWWESQGAFKDPDDEEQLWTIMIERRYDVAVNAVSVFTICKVAPIELTLKDTGNSIPTDSYVKPLINNGKYLNIYVDSTVDNTIQDGSITYPYKSLHQAIHTVMTLSENVAFMCKKGGTYEAQFTYVLNRAVRIQSYGTGNNPIVKVNGSFINCHVSISNVVLMPIVGMSNHQGAAFFLTNCVFLLSNSIVIPLNYDESITDSENYHNKNNWGISSGLVSGQCSYIDINYCKIVGLQYVLYSLKTLSGTFTDITFEQVVNVLRVPEKGTANISVKNPSVSWYTDLTKLISASGVVTVEPFVKFCGWTINNLLIALIVSRKNGASGLTSYKQLDSRTFTETDVNEAIATLVEQEFDDVITEQIPLGLNGKLEQGEYLYNESRFEDAYYNILGCAFRGSTSERPSLTYPFLVKTGMQYFDFEENSKLFWNGTQWIKVSGSGADTYVTLEANSDINNIYSPGKYLCLDMATAQTIAGNPFKDSYPSGFTMIVTPIGDASALGRRMQIIYNFSENKIAIRYSKDLADSQRAGYYSWRFINTQIYDSANGSLKILSIGDSILRGYRNGEKAFFPYITSRYKQDAVSGARLTTEAGYNVKDFAQQLIDEASYTPDIIITGTGVNDWALNAPLGTPPTTVVTNDMEAEALDRTTVYGAVQYLFYQMIKKFPKAQRFFVSATKFNCNVSEEIQGKYVDLNTQGYSYVDMLEEIKKICARYGVVYIDILNKSLVNTEFSTYKAPTKYDDVPEADKDTWNATYYADADGLHPTDLCYREIFAPIIKKEIEIGTLKY